MCVNLRKNRGKSCAIFNFFLHGILWEKGLRLFYTTFVRLIFFFHRLVYSHWCCLQCVRISEKSNMEKISQYL